MTFQSQCSELEQNNQPFIGEILLLEDLLQAVEPVLHMVEGGGEGGYSLLLLLSPVQAAAQPRVEDVGGGQLLLLLFRLLLPRWLRLRPLTTTSHSLLRFQHFRVAAAACTNVKCTIDYNLQANKRTRFNYGSRSIKNPLGKEGRDFIRKPKGKRQ